MNGQGFQIQAYFPLPPEESIRILLFTSMLLM